MSYLLDKLKEWEGKKPEELKKLLYREGFASPKMDTYFEVQNFFNERLKYYNRRRITSPKSQAYYETQKAFGVSESYVRKCLKISFD